MALRELSGGEGDGREPRLRPEAAARSASRGHVLQRVEPVPAGLLAQVRELIAYREFIRLFLWRDLKLRYRQTAIGALWAVLQPLALMVVFSLVLGFLVRMPTDGLPYPLFVFAGLAIWQFFNKSLVQASTSLKDHEGLIAKVYFPRLILPLALIVGGLVDLALTLLVVVFMAALYGFYPSWPIVLLPLFVALGVLAALAFGVWLATLDTVYRDVRQALPVVLQLWMFMAPIVYPTSLLPQSWQAIYALNPMVGIVEGVRWSLTADAPAPDWRMLVISSAVLVLVLASGVRHFRRVEATVIDTL